MKKQRAKTLQQRFGFLDDDLKTPKHDEILILLDNNIQQVVSQAINYKSDWSRGTISRLQKEANEIVLYCKNNVQEEYDELIKESQECAEKGEDFSKWSLDRLDKARSRLEFLNGWDGLGDVPLKEEVEITGVEWENPVMSGKYIVGFIDLTAYYLIPSLRTEGMNYGTRYYSTGRKVINQGNELPKWVVYGGERAIHFEIKSSIPSLGELVRQIKMYKEYKDGYYVVVSPDDRFADQLESQGIGFISSENFNEQT